ncbi:hypothetical protein SULI_02385 [Saccharolobus solfataricus]|uniref:Uncharacterized protein n=3 Tax=Saccharolobus solfataricus TaxID=2287 RepID=Q97VG0_SACS2|nr:hypothetical protein [Saccharolobus solfataricus]AAK42784.1 Hypothetical protein SSO2666 [Saccharolobus solfataricus P2]AKA72875.1 hypothetical protein SULB_0469 [Saccharolobus solfataricus]AKA75574.1 hypothetical protein SULC_0467 [Saccharolobus solfataricus]AKA78267.1 hypothetical protein SULA_0467 [Saccharolobus solfataricus]AZF67385.1 hypothetical protein SULG_02385 [Saccharolobus solfataricus]
MRRRTILAISITILAIGLIDVLFTYLYSSLVVYSLRDNFSLAEEGAQSFPILVKQNDKIIIEGNSSKPIDIYIIGIVPQKVANNVSSFSISYVSPNTGELYIQFRSLPYSNLTTISFTIKVFNSWFSGIGYLSSAIILFVGLILLGYAVQLKERRRK